MKPALVVENLIAENAWYELPNVIISKNGKEVISDGDVWDLPYTGRSSGRIDFSKVDNSSLKWALKAYIRDSLEKLSIVEAQNKFNDCWSMVLSKIDIGETSKHTESVEQRLITAFEFAIANCRENHKLWRMYRPIQWYIWGAENYSELGFSPVYAQSIEAIKIPGNPKGEAVRNADPEKGPLDRTLELPLISEALSKGHGENLQRAQENAAVALFLAFGRNPLSYAYLRECDFNNIADANEDPCFVVEVPRIKKRQRSPRDDLKTEYMDERLALHVAELIRINSNLVLKCTVWDFALPENRPIFISSTLNLVAIKSKDYENLHNFESSKFNQLLRSFVKRHNIRSPKTQKPLIISCRRLRYTLATSLVIDGISRRELAIILDHSDTQHVDVYFDAAESIVTALDRATAVEFSKYLNLFKGKVISGDDEAINGDRPEKHLMFVDDESVVDSIDIGVCGKSVICHLDPPFSCYLCPKFQPYKFSNHSSVLDILLKNREDRLEKYETSRLGVQLDDVIFAVAQVVSLCAEE